MQSRLATLGDKGEVVIPQEFREKLGLGGHESMLFVMSDDGNMQIRPTPLSLDDILGSVTPLSSQSMLSRWHWQGAPPQSLMSELARLGTGSTCPDVLAFH